MFTRKKRPSLVLGREYIDYKDVDLLQKLVTSQGKMLSRRQIGCDARMQHRIKKAVHRARTMGLIPYGP
ncbi:MAG: 30S ribosomal protein S18 [Planctomycetota bacterium]|jgi:small subunit ribosomal protein S18